MNPVARDPKNATQAYLEIAEIRDDVVVLRDGSFRSVLMASSINFDLKSEEEKNAVIYQYQAFLNSLNFPIQILVRSRRINLDTYLHKLGEFEAGEQNELIRLQTSEYIEFIRRLIEVVNIMEKTFYVVMPHYPSGIAPTGASKGILSLFGRKPKTAEQDFQTNKGQLVQRTQLVAQGLGALGVRAAQLQTQELIELFYSFYNPEVQQQEKLVPVGGITGPAVVGAPPAQAGQAVPASPATPEAPLEAPPSPEQAVNLEEQG